MKLKTLYGLPEKVIFCKKSLISNQAPQSTQEFKHTIKSKKSTSKVVKKKVVTKKNSMLCKSMVIEPDLNETMISRRSSKTTKIQDLDETIRTTDLVKTSEKRSATQSRKLKEKDKILSRIEVM